MRPAFRCLLLCGSIMFARMVFACSCADVTPHSCNLLADQQTTAFVGTVVSVDNPPKEGDIRGGTAHYHFHVEEWFSADRDPDVEVLSGRGGADCSFWFETGTPYLVFAHRDSSGQLWTGACSNTQRLQDGGPLVTQLRAMRDRQPVARVYGSLRQVQQPYSGVQQTGFDKTLGNVKLTFESPKRKVVTNTADDGSFAVYKLPPDTYSISADLPADLELAQTILRGPIPKLQLETVSCVQRNLEALPKGKIRGQLLDRNGRPMWNAPVELFSVDGYRDDERGWWEFVDEKKKYFEFNHVAPGEYVIVFNRDNSLDTDVPYPRTFFRNASDLLHAERIHIGPGDQLLHTDIQLSGGAPTRKIKIHVVFAGGGEPAGSLLFAQGSKGEAAFASPLDENLFELNMLLDSQYTITAHTNFCEPETESQPLTFDSTGAPPELTIIVPDTKCRPLPPVLKGGRH
jgi:hypothetical protein